MLNKDLIKKYLIEKIEKCNNDNLIFNSNNVDTIQSQIKQYYKNEGERQALIKIFVDLDNNKFDQ